MTKNWRSISMFWKKFKSYRKKIGGTWYLIEVGKGPVVDKPFSFWSTEEPSKRNEYNESLIKKEEYPV
ncbi:MAG: hypothetical protein ACOCUI_03565 [bacterium]